MNMKNIKLVATDLDGTFLKNDRSISVANLEALHQLGEKVLYAWQQPEGTCGR